MSVNTAVLMGRICNDLELKTTTRGISVLNFRIAVDRAYTPKGGEKKTDFINCCAWRSTAEFIDRYFKKGSMIAVVGSIQTDKYTDKDGKEQYKFEVVIDNASFCGGKQDANATAESAAVAPPADNSAIISFVNSAKEQGVAFEDITTDVDLPF